MCGRLPDLDEIVAAQAEAKLEALTSDDDDDNEALRALEQELAAEAEQIEATLTEIVRTNGAASAVAKVVRGFQAATGAAAAAAAAGQPSQSRQHHCAILPIPLCNAC